jgi:hypothetical protein
MLVAPFIPVEGSPYHNCTLKNQSNFYKIDFDHKKGRNTVAESRRRVSPLGNYWQ